MKNIKYLRLYTTNSSCKARYVILKAYKKMIELPSQMTKLSAANLPIICYLQSTVTSKFTDYLLFTVDCHQQIYRIFAIDSRLSPATPIKKSLLK